MSVCRTKVPRPPIPTELSPRELPAESALFKNLPASPDAPIRILRLDQVIKATGLGKTKIYELQAVGQFPMRVQITARTVGWVEEEVQAWLSRRVAARPALPGRPIAHRHFR